MLSRPNQSTPVPRGFTLVEAVAVVAVGFLLLAFAVTSLVRARQLAQESGSLSNLRRIGAMTGAYQGDFANRLPSLSWTRTYHPSSYADLQFPTDDLQGASFQFTDIIRRRSSFADFPAPVSFIPHLLYSQLVLADHAGLRLPDPVFASPGDALLLQWQRTLVGPPVSGQQRRIFSSSYELTPAAYFSGETAQGGSLRSITNSTWQFNAGASNPITLGPRDASSARYPAQKTLYFESVDRFSAARRLHFGYEDARVPILMLDLAASVRRSGDARRGAYTSPVGSALFAFYDYTPSAVLGDPPLYEGQNPAVDGRLRWTHRLLLGRDFGPAIP